MIFLRHIREACLHLLKKLEEKRQTKAQQERASNSINLYYQIVKANIRSNKAKALKHEGSKRYALVEVGKSLGNSVASPATVQYKYKRPESPPHDLTLLKKSRKSSPSAKPALKQNDSNIASHSLKNNQDRGISWLEEYSRLENEIRVRHYSPRTLRAYSGWVRKFQAFTRSKSPELLSSDDVKEYLTFLAVKRKVSATTQNQAFNSLLFF